MILRLSWFLFAAAAVFALGLFAGPSAKSQESEKTNLCDLKKTPASFNHKLIQVTDFVSHGFENFTLFDPSCPDSPEVWLEYGGKRKSGTIYCCGVSGDRGQRTQELEVENITIPLVDDGSFSDFDKSLHRAPDSVVHATIVGRFFAGEEMRFPQGSRWGGYGHFGCCSLLVIQQILAVDPQDRSDLDYSAAADQPNISKTGCGVQELLSLTPYADALRSQYISESGGHDWMFEDPRRVAADTLGHVLQVTPDSVGKLREIKKAQGRFVYHWKAPEGKASYMIVVSRPYWLSFYARDKTRVAWVALAAYESSCAKTNSVTRVR